MTGLFPPKFDNPKLRDKISLLCNTTVFTSLDISILANAGRCLHKLI